MQERRNETGPVLRAGLTVAIAAGVTLTAATPASAAPDPGEPVIVRLDPGSDPDAAAHDAAARGAEIRFVYHDVFPGYAAVLPPGGLRGVEGGRGIVAIDPDEPVRLRIDGHDEELQAAGQAPWGLDRIDQHACRCRGATPRRRRTGRAKASPPT
jgi:hypothetical protein